MAFYDDIMSGLGTVGEAMQAPRKFLWRDVLGLPESGTELLSQKFGMDPESMMTKGLGFGLETLGDPMSYAPWAIGKAVGMFGKGASAAGKAGRGAAFLEEAAPGFPGVTPEFASAYSRPNVFLSESEAAAARAARPAAGLLEAEPNLLRRAPAAGSQQPSAYADELFARYPEAAKSANIYKNVEILKPEQTAQMADLVSSGGHLPEGMYGARLKGPLGEIGFTGEAANLVPGQGNTLGRMMRAQLSPEEKLAGAAPGLHGFYSPNLNTIVAMRGSAPGTIPHEFMHLLTRRAAETGETEGLPVLQKVAAYLERPQVQQAMAQKAAGLPVTPAKGFRSGMGFLANELGAFAMENPTLAGQLGGGARFMFPKPVPVLKWLAGHPTAWGDYARDAGAISPAARRLYQGIGLSPYAAAAGGAAGLGAYKLANSLGD